VARVILIADPDEKLCRALEDVLVGDGYQVKTALNVKAVVRTLRHPAPPSLALISTELEQLARAELPSLTTPFLVLAKPVDYYGVLELVRARCPLRPPGSARDRPRTSSG
jgi:hypothetical protein